MTDPVCGAEVSIEKGLSLLHLGETFMFCSDGCREQFIGTRKTPPVPELATVPRSDVSAPRIAYFSMEVAAEPSVPTYAGGLGVLAGDFLKSCADLRIPVVAVTLLYRRGYFRQSLDEKGAQKEAPVAWDPSSFAVRRPETVRVSVEGREVRVGVWAHTIAGETGHEVPLLLLDADVEGNTTADRELTASLYGGDPRYRLAQEVILGVGGVRMLRAMGFDAVERFHMNEGHAALLPVELLREGHQGRVQREDVKRVRRRCIFTTHTPVPAGHDHFPYPMVEEIVGSPIASEDLKALGGGDELNMTRLALNLSRFINGVAKRHGEVSQEMFPGYPIQAITNGVHSGTWTCSSLKALFDRYIPEWRNDAMTLRHAMGIPRNELWAAHEEAKEALLGEVVRRTGKPFSASAFTIGFARRVTPYKRIDLLWTDPREILRVVDAVGPVQIVLAGKAHPKDAPGKELIRKVFAMARELEGKVAIAFLEDYDMELGKLLTSGVDLWLNTPTRPLEASGTSGMKAAHNGVPSLSVLDGWWIEGHIEGVTGWSIGPAPGEGKEPTAVEEAAELYRKLRTVIVPMYYANRLAWIDVMRQAIAFNASHFNTHRMALQYAAHAYL